MLKQRRSTTLNCGCFGCIHVYWINVKFRCQINVMLQRRIFMLKQRLNNVETIILFSETFRFPLDRAA